MNKSYKNIGIFLNLKLSEKTFENLNLKSTEIKITIATIILKLNTFSKFFNNNIPHKTPTKQIIKKYFSILKSKKLFNLNINLIKIKFRELDKRESVIKLTLFR